MPLVFERRAGSALVAVQLWLPAGAASEPKDAAGLALLAQQAARASLEPRIAAFAGRGGKLRTTTTPDHTVFELLAPREQLGESLALLAALRSAPATPAAVSRARSWAEAIAVAGERGAGRALAALLRVAFRGRAYGHAATGDAKVIAGLSAASVASFRQAHYRGRALLVVVGDLPFRALAGPVGRHFQPAASVVAGPPARAPVWSLGKGEGLRWHRGEQATAGDRVEIAMGFRLPPVEHPDRLGLQKLALVLDRSRLRRHRSSAGGPLAAASAFVFAGQRAGLLVLRARVARDDLEAGLRALLGEALALGSGGLLGGEARRAAHALRALEAASGQGLAGRARQLGFWADVDPAEPPERDGRQSLSRQARKYLDEGQLTVALVGPRLPSESALDAIVERVRRGPLQALAPATEVLLRGGTRVAIAADPRAPLVAVHARWAAGVARETPREAGTGRVLAGLLQRCQPDGWFPEALAWQARSTLDALEVVAVGLRGSAPGLLARIDACLRSPPWSALDALRRGLLESLPDAAGVSAEARFLAAIHADGHALPLQGTAEGLAGIEASALRAFRLRVLRPSALVIGVAGGVQGPRFLGHAARLFGQSASPRLESSPALPSTPATVDAVVSGLGHAEALVGVALPATKPGERWALRATAAWLQERGLRWAGQRLPLRSSLRLGVERGSFSLAVSVPADAHAAALALGAQLDQLQREPLPAAWFSGWRRARWLARARRRQHVAAQAAELAGELAAGWPRGAAASSLARLDAPQLRTLLAPLLAAARRQVVILRPAAQASPAARRTLPISAGAGRTGTRSR